MDTATSDIHAVEFTAQGEDIATVTADSACDTLRCHSAIIARGATAFGHSLEPVALVPSPPIRNARGTAEIVHIA